MKIEQKNRAKSKELYERYRQCISKNNLKLLNVYFKLNCSASVFSTEFCMNLVKFCADPTTWYIGLNCIFLCGFSTENTSR